MKGAIAKAQQLIDTTPDSWMPQQFDNPANIDVHVRTTAREILADFPEGLTCSSRAWAPAATSPVAHAY
jgi:cysteine synthase A